MKKFLLALLLVGILILGWFLFVKKYDYEFRFKAKYGPASVYKEILEWKKFPDKDTLLPIVIAEKRPFSTINQNIYLKNGELLELEWNLERENDTVTQLVVKTLNSKHSLENRLQILNPFKKSKYVKSLQPKIASLLKDLVKRQKSYTITLKDTATSPAFYCAYISAQATAENKAAAMTANISELEDYLENNNLKLLAHPMVKITRWDFDTDSIFFDFCFPIENREGLTPTRNVKLKTLKAEKSLFAVFHGNFGLSYLAWYDLYEKAKRKGIPVKNLPLEVFYDNPMMGGDDSNWRADVFLPLAED